MPVDVGLDIGIELRIVDIGVGVEELLVPFATGHVVGVALPWEQMPRVTVTTLERAGGLARIGSVLRATLDPIPPGAIASPQSSRNIAA